MSRGDPYGRPLWVARRTDSMVVGAGSKPARLPSAAYRRGKALVRRWSTNTAPAQSLYAIRPCWEQQTYRVPYRFWVGRRKAASCSG